MRKIPLQTIEILEVQPKARGIVGIGGAFETRSGVSVAVVVQSDEDMQEIAELLAGEPVDIDEEGIRPVVLLAEESATYDKLSDED